MTRLEHTLSHPILHSLVKAHLIYDAVDILKLCSTLPETKRSRIFLDTTPHKFYDAREEWFVDGIKYPADAVWRFRSIYDANKPGVAFVPSYYIIHEIKTGHYDLKTEMKKHYIHHNHVQLFIWAYKKYHAENTYVPYTFVKFLNIEVLKPYIINNTRQLLKSWEGN